MTPAKVAEKLKSYANDSDKLIRFAKIAGNFKNTTNAINSGAFDSANKNYSIEIADDAGYYLVEESDIPGNDDDETNIYSRYMLKVAGDVTIAPKRPTPTLDKVIASPNPKDDGKANSVSIGDVVTYTLTSTVPDMKGYDKYFFIVNDDLDEGLTFNNDVSIKINDQTINAAHYEVQTVPEETDGHTFQIVFTNFYDNYKDKNGQPIEITYSATLNENANRGTAGNVNTAYLTYSNNPNFSPRGENEPAPSEPNDPDTPEDESIPDPVGNTPEQETKTYTTNLILNKTNENGEPLTGAKFQITGTSANVVLVNGTAYQKDDAGSYYKLKDGTFTETAPNNDNLYDGTDKYKKVTNVRSETTYNDICMDAYVKSDGSLEFGGLGPGTYKITELKAPDGYNKLENDITVVITNDDATFASPAWNATKDGEPLTSTNTEAKVSFSFNVVNREGATLPSTGGIGTKLFYLFGGMLVVGSSVVLITKKRMSADDN
jgi:fimbrial isopeptide formation D2 family protein/LPXTG-motif cell wall-anchored protein